MLLYWKYREGNKLLSLPPGTCWYMSCESDPHGNYMLMLITNGIRMTIEDGFIYSVRGPEMDDGELRSFFNSIIDNVASAASGSPRIIDIEEIKHSLIMTKYPECEVFDDYGEDADDGGDDAGDYDDGEDY